MRTKTFIFGLMAMLALCIGQQPPLLAAKKADKKEKHQKHSSSSSSDHKHHSKKKKCCKETLDNVDLGSFHIKHHHKNGKTKYVQGGLCYTGDGSKESPYNSLALAQADTRWTTLIVLPSLYPLDGGITLKHGQKLIGNCNPVGVPTSGVPLPIISNTSDENGGNGVLVESGDVTINNIFFQDTQGAAIRYDNARNILIKNVVATNWNLSESFFLEGDLPTNFEDEVSALSGNLKNNGKTTICNVKLFNGHTGAGITEIAYGGSQRSLKVNKADIYGITTVFPADAIEKFNILLTGLDVGTKYDVVLDKVYVHDSADNTYEGVQGKGIGVASNNGSRLNILIKNSSFVNLHRQADDYLWEIYFESRTRRLDLRQAGVITYMNATVKDTLVQEFDNRDSVAATQIQTNYGEVVMNVCNNKFIDVGNGFVSYEAESTNNKYRIENNYIRAGDILYFLTYTRDNSPTYPDNVNLNLDAIIRGNTGINKVSYGSGIYILPGIDIPEDKWTLLNILVENNCFNGGSIEENTDGAGIGAFPYSTTFGNATLTARNNNIVNYFYDVYDEEPGMIIDARQNWWGPGGADNVYDPAVKVNVSNSLQSPIICPVIKFCPSLPPINNVNGAEIEQEPAKVKAMVSERKE